MAADNPLDLIASLANDLAASERRIADLERRINPAFREPEDPIETLLPKSVHTDVIGHIPSCRVYNNANLVIPNNAATALTFNAERYDNDNIHSTTTNTNRLTCVTPGVYTVWLNVFWDSSAVGVREIWIRLNGGNAIDWEARPASSAGDHAQSISSDFKLAAGDYVEAIVFQNTGGNLNVLNLQSTSPEFGMTWVSHGLPKNS